MPHSSPPSPVIDPCWDPVFKAIFTKDSGPSRIARTALLSALLERKVGRLTISANEVPVSCLGDRQIRYDINCTFDSGEKANVEMTLYPHPREALRLEYYSGCLFTRQDIQGKDKSFKDLCNTYQISFLGNRNLFGDEYFDHKFIYYDPDRNICLGGRTAILVLELGKLERIAGKAVCEMSGKERWGIFFKYYTDLEKQDLLEAIMKAEEGIAMAGEIARGFTKEVEEYFYRISKEKYLLDMRAHAEEAVEEARIEARAEARAEMEREVRRQDLETAQKMKDRGFSPEEIRELLPRLTPEDIR
jgi:predicted transposase/invertase (TIGR01784 family)